MTIILFGFIALFILYFINGEKILFNYFNLILNKKFEINKRQKAQKIKDINKKDNKNKDLKKSKHHHHHRKKDSKEKIKSSENRHKHHKKNQHEESHHKRKNKKETQDKNEKRKEKTRNKHLNQSYKENNINNKKVLQKRNNNISFPPKNKEKIDNIKNESLKKENKRIKNNLMDKFENSIDIRNSFVILDEKLRYSIIKNRHILLNEQELNNVDYSQALKLDKRTFCKYYRSLIITKELILFTFLNQKDYNLKTIKICLFCLNFSLYFTINGFFFTDDTMHKIYKNNGAYKIIHQIPIMLYSTIISIAINMLLKKLSLTDQNILEFKQEKDFKVASKISKEILKCIKIKLAIFYSLNFIFILFFWYFISCFCGVYNNTQVILIKDTLISFSLSLIYPFALSLIPGLFRIPSLRAKNKDKECMYKVSIIIAYI